MSRGVSVAPQTVPAPSVIDMKIKLNQQALDKLAREAARRQEPTVNAVLHETLRELRNEMTGQPADEIETELVKRLSARIPGFTPAPQLRELAEAIEAGTLED
jgi:hypothetical protein